jgi:hypothetical protein
MKYDVHATVHLNLPDIDKSGASYLAVLIKHEFGDNFTGYAALVQLGARPQHRLYEKARNVKAQRVAALGVKLTFGQAQAHWPAIKLSQYV